MITKYDTGDAIYIPVEIDKAVLEGGRVYYTLKYRNGFSTIDEWMPEDAIVEQDGKLMYKEPADARKGVIRKMFDWEKP